MAEQAEQNETNQEDSTEHNWHEAHNGKMLKTDFRPMHEDLNRRIENKLRQLSRMRYLAIVLLLVASLGLGYLGGWLGSRNNNALSADSPISSKQVVLSSEGQVISKIASAVGQSVVSVTASQAPSASSNIGDLLFGGLGGNSNGQAQGDEGTGIIISADGLIITNRHVVPVGTTSVSVTLSDGTQYNNVKIVGRTSESDSLDIAFLQIQNLNGKKLVPATIGNSSEMNVGDPVVAIGNALGQFQNTVTSGIISGYGRSVQASDGSNTSSTSENLDDLFQTDAAINEGNSGGPLVNLSGQVIGINTAIASDAQNIGFAIPINDVSGLIKSVEQSGKLQQPYLGVLYIPLTSDVAKQYNLSVTRGAWLPPSGITGQSAIVSGGPADKAGLKTGDVITAINGTTINENTSLTSIIDKLAVGAQVNLTVNRNGKTINLTVTLGAAPTS